MRLTKGGLMAAKRERNTRPLVIGYLERIASSAFSEFPQQITDLVHGKHGVYALYKGDRLYYVGLATNLRNRIKHHLRDRHAGKWNRFSLYLVRRAEHIKELEALILRISDPKGNRTKGRLPGADNLLGDLHKSIRKQQDQQIEVLFGKKRAPRKRKSAAQAKSTSAKKSRLPALAPYVTKRFLIRRTYKGKMYTAKVLASGKIRFNNQLYNSPSLAGAAAVRRKTCNGWTFWRYQDPSGNWVKLDNLRRQ